MGQGAHNNILCSSSPVLQSTASLTAYWARTRVKYLSIYLSGERERERDRERQRETERDRERQRETEREARTDRQKHTETQTNRQTDTHECNFACLFEQLYLSPTSPKGED